MPWRAVSSASVSTSTWVSMNPCRRWASRSWSHAVSHRWQPWHVNISMRQCFRCTGCRTRRQDRNHDRTIVSLLAVLTASRVILPLPDALHSGAGGAWPGHFSPCIRGKSVENGTRESPQEGNRRNYCFRKKNSFAVRLEGNGQKKRGTVVLQRKRFTNRYFPYAGTGFSWLPRWLWGMLMVSATACRSPGAASGPAQRNKGTAT